MQELLTYHNRPELNNSKLKHLVFGDLDAFYFELFKEKTESESLFIGTASHMTILEPQEFFKTYFVAPYEVNATTKESKLSLEAWKEEAKEKGLTFIRFKDFETCYTLRDEFLRHKEACKIMKGANFEVEIYSEIAGVECKGKIDILPIDDVITDYKTTSFLHTFEKEIYSKKYLSQAGFYTLLYPRSKAFRFIAQCKTYGTVRIFEIKGELLLYAQKMVLDAIEIYKSLDLSKKPDAQLNHPVTTILNEIPSFLI